MNTLIILGAGASVDSGLRTYRGPGGLYETVKIPDVSDRRHNVLGVFRTLQMIAADSRVEPGPTYKALRKLARGACVVTQNVDGLAPRALGDVAASVVELHGHLRTCHCPRCLRECPTPEALFRKEPPIEKTEIMCKCGGFLVPNVVLCGDAYDQRMLRTIYTYITRMKPQRVLVVGTTLVFPAFRDFINRAKQRGAHVCHVNPDPEYAAVMNAHRERCYSTMGEYIDSISFV